MIRKLKKYQVKHNVLAAGMNAHIAKPIDIAKLKSTLAQFLCPPKGGTPR